MASADQLKALLKSHLEGDDERFFSVAMQVAAHEAKPRPRQARGGVARVGRRGKGAPRSATTRREDGNPDQSPSRRVGGVAERYVPEGAARGDGAGRYLVGASSNGSSGSSTRRRRFSLMGSAPGESCC